MTKKVEDNATVIAVFPDKIKILVHNIGDFIADSQEEKLRVGSYLEIADDDEVKLIAIVERYSIEMIQIDNNGAHDRKYIIEAMPLGVINSEGFCRGGDQIALPPKTAKIASYTTIHAMYNTGFQEKSKFIFSSLSMNPEISVPVNGDQFFNKHIAIVGSTGSGKSHTVAAILQAAISAKSQALEEETKNNIAKFKGLNNSHIVIFDMHSEYKSAFPEAEILDIDNLILPYWLLSSEELEEYFIDSEVNDHNQRNIFKEAVVRFKKDQYSPYTNSSIEIHYDSPVMFDIHDVYKYICDKNKELIDTGEEYPSLQQGEAFMIGESVTIPSLVKINKCSKEPSSSDILYLQQWKEAWFNVDFDKFSEARIIV